MRKPIPNFNCQLKDFIFNQMAIMIPVSNFQLDECRPLFIYYLKTVKIAESACASSGKTIIKKKKYEKNKEHEHFVFLAFVEQILIILSVYDVKV